MSRASNRREQCHEFGDPFEVPPQLRTVERRWPLAAGHGRPLPCHADPEDAPKAGVSSAALATRGVGAPLRPDDIFVIKVGRVIGNQVFEISADNQDVNLGHRWRPAKIDPQPVVTDR